MSEAQSIAEVWGTSLSAFYCPHCRTAHLASAETTLGACPACLQAEVSSEPEQVRREPPELVIPFAITSEQANSALAGWAKRMWFRPDDLRADILLSRVRPYYFSLWLVDSDLEASWQAEMGYDYQAASYREHYDGGRWISQEVTETRVRWEPRVGRLKRHYDNVAVPAMSTHDEWMTRLGGYDYRSRKKYSSNAIARSVVRIPDHDTEAAWPDAERMLNRTASIECKSASEADHVRNWKMHARYHNLNWTQMLAPAYVTYYREGEGVHPVWINGQSGRVYGVKYMSQRKATVTSLVLGALAALLFLFGAVLALIGSVLVLPLVIGALLVVLAILLGLAAPVPAIWVWLKTRRQREKGART
jgi:hypothetical protein